MVHWCPHSRQDRQPVGYFSMKVTKQCFFIILMEFTTMLSVNNGSIGSVYFSAHADGLINISRCSYDECSSHSNKVIISISTIFLIDMLSHAPWHQKHGLCTYTVDWESIFLSYLSLILWPLYGIECESKYCAIPWCYDKSLEPETDQCREEHTGVGLSPSPLLTNHVLITALETKI